MSPAASGGMAKRTGKKQRFWTCACQTLDPNLDREKREKGWKKKKKKKSSNSGLVLQSHIPEGKNAIKTVPAGSSSTEKREKKKKSTTNSSIIHENRQK